MCPQIFTFMISPNAYLQKSTETKCTRHLKTKLNMYGRYKRKHCAIWLIAFLNIWG